MDTQAPITTSPVKTEKIKLYNPKEYFFMGFLFSPIATFFMAFSNAKKLKEINNYGKGLIKYFIAYLSLITGTLGIGIYSTLQITKALKENITLTDIIQDKSLEQIIPEKLKFFDAFMNNTDLIAGAIGLIILALTVYYTNKNEKPIYDKLKEEEKIKTKSAFLPFIIGLAFSAALYFGFQKIIEIIVINSL